MKKVVFGIIIIFLAIGGYFGYQVLTSPKYNYVTIDVNAQIEFALNDKYEVMQVTSLNEDADIALEGLKLVGLSLEDATKLVIEDAIKLGYIDEFKPKNRINVTAYTDEETIRKRIEEKISVASIKFLKEKNILHSVIKAKISDELKKTAEQNKISYGKMLLIEKAHSLNNSLDKEKLMKSSIKEIQEIINESVKARIKEKKMTKKQYKDVIKKQKEEKIKENDERIKRIIIEVLKIDDTDNFSEEFLNEAKEKVKREIRNNPKIDLDRFLR